MPRLLPFSLCVPVVSSHRCRDFLADDMRGLDVFAKDKQVPVLPEHCPQHQSRAHTGTTDYAGLSISTFGDSMSFSFKQALNAVKSKLPSSTRKTFNASAIQSPQVLTSPRAA